MLVFYNKNIIDHSLVSVSPFDRGFQFGDGVYEVIRYYPKMFFMFEKHIRRLKYSLREMDIEEPDLTNLENILFELINKNGFSEEPAIAYLQITRGVQFPRRHIPNDQISPTFFIYVEKFPIKEIEMKKGVKAGLEEDIRWNRCDIKTISLIPNILSKNRAAAKGLNEIIWHRNGIITEGTQTNVFCVIENKLFTHPLNTNILAGITQEVVIDLSESLSIPCIEQEIKVEEFKNADEIFLTSTTSEVTPVIEIEGKLINCGEPGPVTQSFQREYKKLYI